jgi:hypothetical protein
VAAVLAVACTEAPSAPAVSGQGRRAPDLGDSKVLATFEGSVDPLTRKVTIRRSAPATDPNALTAYEPVQDGAPGTGPADTFELVTDLADPVGAVSNGCSEGVDSFEGSIILRSFYVSKKFVNVYIELTNVSPSGFEGCNSAPAVPGVGATFGLWSYGTIGPAGGAPGAPDNQKARWKFTYTKDQSFTFTGRIMAVPGPELDWTPASITTPVRKFQDVATTTVHLVWSGTEFVDQVGTTTVTAQGTPKTTSVGLVSTPDLYADFSNASYYTASPGAALKTDGDFSVCVRFKPGANPTGPGSKVLVARGQPEAGDGWALVQTYVSGNGTYAFAYNANSTLTVPWVPPGWDGKTTQATTPEAWPFDYVCGGRNGGDVVNDAHGRWRSLPPTTLSASFADDASLPLAIGAYDDGTHPASDAGVYEVIFDSRAATEAVFQEIVGAAEGRFLPSSGDGSQLRISESYVLPSAHGFDGLDYTLPPYATAPLAADVLGPIVPGTNLEYVRPFAASAATSGYCAGAEVAANGAWALPSLPSGGVIQWGNAGTGVVSLVIGGNATGPGYYVQAGGGSLSGFVPGATAWTDGSAHTYVVCVTPGNPGTLALYVDPAPGNLGLAPPASAYSSPFDAGAANVTLGIGNPITNVADFAGAPPLSGGRIRRVFFCPSDDPRCLP